MTNQFGDDDAASAAIELVGRTGATSVAALGAQVSALAGRRVRVRHREPWAG